MSEAFGDTSPEMEARYLAMILERPPGGQRLRITTALAETSRRLLVASIRAARPDITEVELRQELFLRYYGDEFAPDERARILAGIADYWERNQTPGRTDGAASR